MPKSALERVREALRKRGEATRPQLAAETGLSLVSCNQAVATLCQLGEAQEAGLTPSGGGRPGKRYRINARFACRAYFKAERNGSLIHGELELYDMTGNLLRRHNAEYAYLSAESLDEWLDAATRHCGLYGISLEISSDIVPARMVEHLESRYRCPARILNTADALADDSENTLTLYISQGKSPVCSLRLGGKQQHTGELGLLPLPADWCTLDYSDHTLVEEMIARLVTILVCTLAPMRVVLFGDFWTNRLTKRIQFNVSAKLRQGVPLLHFRTITHPLAADRLRAFACSI